MTEDSISDSSPDFGFDSDFSPDGFILMELLLLLPPLSDWEYEQQWPVSRPA